MLYTPDGLPYYARPDLAFTRTFAVETDTLDQNPGFWTLDGHFERIVQMQIGISTLPVVKDRLIAVAIDLPLGYDYYLAIVSELLLASEDLVVTFHEGGGAQSLAEAGGFNVATVPIPSLYMSPRTRVSLHDLASVPEADQVSPWFVTSVAVPTGPAEETAPSLRQRLLRF